MQVFGAFAPRTECLEAAACTPTHSRHFRAINPAKRASNRPPTAPVPPRPCNTTRRNFMNGTKLSWVESRVTSQTAHFRTQERTGEMERAPFRRCGTPKGSNITIHIELLGCKNQWACLSIYIYIYICTLGSSTEHSCPVQWPVLVTVQLLGVWVLYIFLNLGFQAHFTFSVFVLY